MRAVAPVLPHQQRWSLDSIDWRAVPRGAANPEDPLFYLVAAASFMEITTDLYTRNLITYEEALLRASNPDDFKLRIQGIRSASDSAREEMERSMTEFERSGRR